MKRLCRYFLRIIKPILVALGYWIWPGKGYQDSVLAVYDFRASPYTYNFIEFLANAEVYRIKNGLSFIDLIFVVDSKNYHRGDQPEVTTSNYRNWILNLAECAECLRSINSFSLFESTNKFLGFYLHLSLSCKTYPENSFCYVPKSQYHLSEVADYFRKSGFVPRFQSSQVLLDWAENYFIKESYPSLPVVVFVRNSKTNPGRNTKWPVWLDFMRAIIAQYDIKFFIVNDFWNPVEIPVDLKAKVVISREATISSKYRSALTQRASLLMGQCIGSSAYCFFIYTPHLLFGYDNEYYSAELNIKMHGFNSDLRPPWATSYQMVYPQHGDVDYIKERFDKMYQLLDRDKKLISDYFKRVSALQ